MDFELNEEQRALEDVLTRLLREKYTAGERRQLLNSELGWSRAVWQQFAELGILGFSLPASDDGYLASPVDIMLVMQALGRSLALEPYVATALVGAGLLCHGSDSQRALLPQVAGGKLILAFAHLEPTSRFDLNHVTLKATRRVGGFSLDGKKVAVVHGDRADYLIVAARTSGEQFDEEGITLFLVPADRAGMVRQPQRSQDGQRMATVELRGLEVADDEVIGVAGYGAAPMRSVVETATLALCAEAVGAMEVTFEQTLEYLKTRRQFGVPIGSFQALQHRAADMLIALEQARSVTLCATMHASHADAGIRSKWISSAKMLVGQASRFLGQSAIQMHGGIGVTDECDISHYFKRLTMIDLAYGDAEHHLREVARRGGLIAPIHSRDSREALQ